MTDDLKPCPFCGGRAIKQMSAKAPFVYCESCDANGTERDTIEEAIFEWNTRTPAVAETPSGWRSMDSAPKDGSIIVARNRDVGGKRGYTLIHFDDGFGWCGYTSEDEKRMVKYEPQEWYPIATPSPDTQDAVQEAARVLLGDDLCNCPITKALEPFNNDVDVWEDVKAALRAIEGER